MAALFDPYLVKTRHEDREMLEKTQLPIVTVSSTYREDLKRLHGYPNDNSTRDIVFSRAHYSMALGIAVAVWKNSLSPKKAWIVDPTNYVSAEKWRTITLTEFIGKTIARHSLLKTLKDVIDKFGRKKLPILDSITPPLLYLTENVSQPILSLHIATGNILASQGKRVVQVVTDPHVRSEYVDNAHLPTIQFCVFDERTKLEFLEKAALMEKDVDPRRVIVTGPPVDPRIVATRKKKYAWRSGELRLCLTTGGLGTNKAEIITVLEQLLPELRKRPSPYKLLIYAGTHADIYEDVLNIAQKSRVAVSSIDDTDAKLRILYHPQIMDANELLIKYAFSWAHGFISKPSGDMAYDAAASGSFLLTLSEWGEWEYNVRNVFECRSISRKLELEHVVPQLEFLMSAAGRPNSWIERAMNSAQKIEPLFLNGAKEIAEVALKEK